MPIHLSSEMYALWVKYPASYRAQQTSTFCWSKFRALMINPLAWVHKLTADFTMAWSPIYETRGFLFWTSWGQEIKSLWKFSKLFYLPGTSTLPDYRRCWYFFRTFLPTIEQGTWRSRTKARVSIDGALLPEEYAGRTSIVVSVARCPSRRFAATRQYITFEGGLTSDLGLSREGYL